MINLETGLQVTRRHSVSTNLRLRSKIVSFESSRVGPVGCSSKLESVLVPNLFSFFRFSRNTF